MLVHESALRQRVEILRRRLPADAQVGHHELDPGIGVAEEVVQKILRIEPRKLAAHPVLGLCHLAADSLYQRKGRLSRPGYGRQHVKGPGLPVLLFAHPLQQPVILVFRARDVAAEIEDGTLQQPGAREIEHIQDAADPAIAVRKRVDALELMVDQRHLDQRIERADRIVVDEALQRSHVCEHQIAVLWRHVDDGAAAVVPESGAGAPAEPIAAPLQKLKHVDEGVVADDAAARTKAVMPQLQCVAIERHFLGRRVGLLRKQFRLEQLILRGDDILDLGTRLGLLQCQGVDQDALVRDRGGPAFQFRKRPVGGGQCLQHRHRLQIDRRGQVGNPIAGF